MSKRETPNPVIPLERIERATLLIRGQKVMLDRDLAALYGVETRALNQAVTRNARRFPSDFMFELTREEIMGISQSVISSADLKRKIGFEVREAPGKVPHAALRAA